MVAAWAVAAGGKVENGELLLPIDLPNSLTLATLKIYARCVGLTVASFVPLCAWCSNDTLPGDHLCDACRWLAGPRSPPASATPRQESTPEYDEFRGRYEPLPKDSHAYRFNLDTLLKGGRTKEEKAEIAREIEEGRLFNKEGRPRGYWHCLATKPPPAPPGRRGQWKASGQERYESDWGWQDWGPA